MFHRKALSLLVIAAALAGCSSTKTVVVTKHNVEFEQDNRNYIHSVETTEERPLQMGGTAILEPATIHVMADHRRTNVPVETSSQEPKPELDRSLVKKAASQLDAIRGNTGADKQKREQIAETAIKEMNQIEAGDKGKRVDAYDMQLWQRYCNRGKGMTSDDWSQMLGSSTDQIPDTLLKNCRPPDLEVRPALIRAYCKKKPLTNKQRYIIQQNKTDPGLSCH